MSNDWLDRFEPSEKNQSFYTRLAGGFLLLAAIGLGAVQYFKMGPYADPIFYDAVPSIIHYLPYIGAAGSALMLWKPEFFQSKSDKKASGKSDDK